ncbi:DMT family transporter [Pseudoxanthobacter sp.]|uniref:DMT family transporter n=1 Tax=Pseudoxanthobacter sp. TaxID=1925742 RepID=UPI002FDF444D
MTLAVAGQRADDTRLRGIVLMLITCVFFAALDATAKTLARTLPPLEVAWFRYFIHMVLLAIVLKPWRLRSTLRTKRLGMQALRSAFLLGSTVFNFIALRYLQLAETTSINFAGPLVITALAGPLLGEWADRRRWAAVGVGFLGVLIIVQPGTGALAFEAVYSVAAMVCNAIYAILTRRLAPTESSAGMLMWSSIFGTLALSPTLPAVWVMPHDWQVWVLLVCLGAFGAIGHYFLIRGHAYAPASLLAPFGYSQIIWATAAGYLVFSQLPHTATVAGSVVIVASGLYILKRENVMPRRRR